MSALDGLQILAIDGLLWVVVKYAKAALVQVYGVTIMGKHGGHTGHVTSSKSCWSVSKLDPFTREPCVIGTPESLRRISQQLCFGLKVWDLDL